MAANVFLEELEPNSWIQDAQSGVRPVERFHGANDSAIEVAYAEADARPSVPAVRSTWVTRHAKRAVTLLLVVRYSTPAGVRMALCGGPGENPPVIHDLEPSQVERLCLALLAEPDRIAGARLIARHMPEMESELPGVRNSGMLAMHELVHGVPTRSDWEASKASGSQMLAARGRSLIERLDFAVEDVDTSSFLKIDDHKRAIAVFLQDSETFEDTSERFGGVSPVSKALAVADIEGLPWVVLTRGSQIRLYARRPDTGVGRKGRAETYIELDLALLPESSAGYLPLLFGAEALKDHGTFEEILEECTKFAAALGHRLRERVYYDAVPSLATAIAEKAEQAAPEIDPRYGEEDLLGIAYEMTMLVLFRLLFVAYAEDKDLLPYRTNSRYQEHSLKGIAQRLTELRRDGHDDFDDNATSFWTDVSQIWEAIAVGNTEWGVPAYAGGLFASDDADEHVAGAVLSRISLTNAEFGRALTAMLVDEDDEGTIGPVDFRSLSVREFGTIYEGLLESELSRAPSDLTIKRVKGDDTYVPAKKNDPVEVEAGEIYFHNSSGVRKSTGSYFTKPFAVEHLLDHALEPALDDHLQRVQDALDDGDDELAAGRFFDFRCVDLAMGSGHFLVAAVDRIEARLSAFLTKNPIPRVQAELDTLRSAAVNALGELAVGVEIETASLLRRQVARRCIYGVDLNRIAAELARLGIWVHTFVPGLPLSFLDRTLVEGNALTGIGTIEEAVEALDGTDRRGTVSLFAEQIHEFLARSEEYLRKLATIAEATTEDLERSRAAHEAAAALVEPAGQLFDIVVTARAGDCEMPLAVDEADLAIRHVDSGAAAVAEELSALHFPIAFPEAFVGERPGFDCILGNPPWEKTQVEEHQWWGMHLPGIRSLSVAKMNAEIEQMRKARPDLVQDFDEAVAAAGRLRDVLLRGPYPELGSSHPDLYKAFAWRSWQLIRSRGSLGLVLPRSALSSSGMAAWRERVLDEGDFVEVTNTTNTKGWVFDDAEPRYTIAFVSIRKTGVPDDVVAMRGPYSSLDAYRKGRAELPVELPAEGLRKWTTGAAFPMIPGRRAGEVFLKMRAHPRLDEHPDFTFRPVQGDLNATTGKKHMVLEPTDPAGLWPVYKGASFRHWEPDTGTYYAYAKPGIVVRHLIERRKKSARREGSPFRLLTSDELAEPATLACGSPRIAWRRVSRATDTRTVIPALVPPGVVLQDKAAYFERFDASPSDEAFLLGILSSTILDWFARRVVELQVDFHVINGFPVPGRGSAFDQTVVDCAANLAAVDERYERWFTETGASSLSEDRSRLTHRLDAAAAHLFELDARDIQTIFDTFHEGADYSETAAAVIEEFEALK